MGGVDKHFLCHDVFLDRLHAGLAAGAPADRRSLSEALIPAGGRRRSGMRSPVTVIVVGLARVIAFGFLCAAEAGALVWVPDDRRLMSRTNPGLASGRVLGGSVCPSRLAWTQNYIVHT